MILRPQMCGTETRLPKLRHYEAPNQDATKRSLVLSKISGNAPAAHRDPTTEPAEHNISDRVARYRRDMNRTYNV